MEGKFKLQQNKVKKVEMFNEMPTYLTQSI